jgi:PKD repeat protein
MIHDTIRYRNPTHGGKKMRREPLQKGIAISIALLLIFLIIIVFIPSFSAVKLSPGTPNKSSVTINTIIIFNDVNLTIRSNEAIPVDYLNFRVFRSNDNSMVAQLNFSILGTKRSETPAGAFTMMNVTNTSDLTYNSTWGFGKNETSNTNQTFNHGYGYGPTGSYDMTILYRIEYTTQFTGTFYAKLFVNSTNYTYVSAESSPFTVNPPPPPGGGGGGGDRSSNEAPVADAGGPYRGYVNTPITFSGSKSTDDTEITGYRWDWTNDGIYDTDWSTVAITTHTYLSKGIYTLRLQVKDTENLTASNTTTVNITTITNDTKAPVADAAGPYKSLTYQNIHFDGSNSHGNNASIISYLWSFGDGTYGYNVTATHAYETAGTFTVNLTVTDSNNLIAIDGTTATIELDANRNNISDALDEAIGVNITQADLHSLTIDGTLCYLFDTNHDGIYDYFYNSATKTKTVLGQQQGKYLIDVNGDGKWEYIYDPAYDTISPFNYENTSSEIPWMYVGLIVFIVAIIVVIVLFYLRKNCYI